MDDLDTAQVILSMVADDLPRGAPARHKLATATAHIERARRRTAIPEMLLIRDLCCLFDISEKTARRLCRNGTFPAAKIGGRYYVERKHLLVTIRRMAEVPEVLPENVS